MSVSPSPQRIWSTVDGRYVLDGDPDAAFLAFGPGDEVPKSILDKLKAAPAPADKAVKAPVGDKAAVDDDSSDSEPPDGSRRRTKT